jgi:hypothetical protein
LVVAEEEDFLAGWAELQPQPAAPIKILLVAPQPSVEAAAAAAIFLVVAVAAAAVCLVGEEGPLRVCLVAEAPHLPSLAASLKATPQQVQQEEYSLPFSDLAAQA